MVRRSRTADSTPPTPTSSSRSGRHPRAAATATASAAPAAGQNAAQVAGSAFLSGDGQARRRAVRFSVPPRQRRRGWLAGAVALLALAVVVNVYLVRSAGQRVPAVVVVRDVPIGQQISRADVGTTWVSADTSVQLVPGRQLPEVVGMRAAVSLRRGSLLTPTQITGEVTPQEGQALVAVAVKPSQLPAGGLAPGTSVTVIATPAAQGQQVGTDAVTGEAAALSRDVPARVDQASGPDVDGLHSLSLLVAQADAAALARQASTGRIAVIVTARTS